MSFSVKPTSEVNAIRNRVSGGLDLARLPPFLRVLLTTDGTVTNALEAFFWEAVVVESIRQKEILLNEDVPNLELKSGASVLSRQVQLRGTKSETVYVKADSIIRFNLLSPDFQADLKAQKLGVGELLRDCGLETYREILEVGCDEGSQEVWRTYRIVMDHRPFIQITEHFPLAVFQR